MTAILQVEDLGVSLGGRQILGGINLSLQPGARVALIGANGAGKTTLLDCIGGQLSPDRGRVLLGGQTITAWAPHRRARAGIARSFQRLGLVSTLSVLENVQLGLHMLPIRTRGDAALRLLAQCKYEGAPEALAQDLSLLDRKRVALARCLVPQARLILLDEPASGLTPEQAQSLLQVLRTRQDVAVLWVEHDLNLLAGQTQRTLVLHEGGIVADLDSQELLEHPMVKSLYLGSGAP